LEIGAVKVLIAEDNCMNMELVKDILTLNGYETIEASTGAEAIKLVAAEKPDIVLMDLHMPTMDGMTAMRILKSDEAYREIPVLALTAAAGRAETEDVLARGFDGCVIKPIDKEVLLNKIRFFTGKKSAP
jgi:two-component system cell cycle response regulator DivK